MEVLRLPQSIHTTAALLHILLEHDLLDVYIWRRVLQDDQLMRNNPVQYLFLFLLIVDVINTGCLVELILAAAHNRVSPLVVNNAINI